MYISLYDFLELHNINMKMSKIKYSHLYGSPLSFQLCFGLLWLIAAFTPCTRWFLIFAWRLFITLTSTGLRTSFLLLWHLFLLFLFLFVLFFATLLLFGSFTLLLAFCTFWLALSLHITIHKFKSLYLLGNTISVSDLKSKEFFTEFLWGLRHF